MRRRERRREGGRQEEKEKRRERERRREEKRERKRKKEGGKEGEGEKRPTNLCAHKSVDLLTLTLIFLWRNPSKSTDLLISGAVLLGKNSRLGGVTENRLMEVWAFVS